MLPKGQWINEKRIAIKNAEAMADLISDGDTLILSVAVDEKFPEEVREAIRENIRQEVDAVLAQKQAKALILERGVAVAVSRERLTKLEERLAKVEDKEQSDLPDPAIWRKVKEIEERIG